MKQKKSKKSEILQELEDNVREIEVLISKQKFTVADARKFLERYYNIYRKMEQLVISRDKWKNKYIKLKGA